MESDELADDAAGIAALAEPVRRSLYEFVSRQPDAVSREQAAAAVGVPAHTAKFHLERLVTEGLLDVEFRRLSGRSGPGAGRPSKLYRRSSREIEVSLPQRHYDLLGRILAEAVEQCHQNQGRGRRRRRRGGSPRGPGCGRGRFPARRRAHPDRRHARAAGLRAARRRRPAAAGELPLRPARPGPHRARLRTQPGVRRGSHRRSRLPRADRRVGAEPGTVLRGCPAALTGSAPRRQRMGKHALGSTRVPGRGAREAQTGDPP